MKHPSKEMMAFKNKNAPSPYDKIVASTELGSLGTHMSETVDGQATSTELEKTEAEPESLIAIPLELGRLGVTVLKTNSYDHDPIVLDEATNRGNISAAIIDLALPLSKAARLQIPPAADNKRGMFGGLKTYPGEVVSLQPVVSEKAENGYPFTYSTTVNYVPGKDQNTFRYMTTSVQLVNGSEIGQVFMNANTDETIGEIKLTINNPNNSNGAGSTPIPTVIKELYAFCDKLNLKGHKSISFGLNPDYLGAVIKTQWSENTDQIIYEPEHNIFKLQSDPRVQLTVEEFVDFVECCAKVVPTVEV